MKKPTAIFVFDNLNIAVLDKDGQVPELQKSVTTLIAEHSERLGYDLDGCIVETRNGNWRVFRTSDGGWNHEQA